MPPYADDAGPATIPAPRVALRDLGVGIRRWQHDLWYLIVQAALEGHPESVAFAELPGFDAPAISQYAATTPSCSPGLPRSTGPDYREQVRPFGFLTAMQVGARLRGCGWNSWPSTRLISLRADYDAPCRRPLRP